MGKERRRRRRRRRGRHRESKRELRQKKQKKQKKKKKKKKELGGKNWEERRRRRAEKALFFSLFFFFFSYLFMPAEISIPAEIGWNDQNWPKFFSRWNKGVSRSGLYTGTRFSGCSGRNGTVYTTLLKTPKSKLKSELQWKIQYLKSNIAKRETITISKKQKVKLKKAHFLSILILKEMICQFFLFNSLVFSILIFFFF